jgi:hypothetical protein
MNSVSIDLAMVLWAGLWEGLPVLLIQKMSIDKHIMQLREGLDKRGSLFWLV